MSMYLPDFEAEKRPFFRNDVWFTNYTHNMNKYMKHSGGPFLKVEEWSVLVPEELC